MYLVIYHLAEMEVCAIFENSVITEKPLLAFSFQITHLLCIQVATLSMDKSELNLLTSIHPVLLK